MIVSVSIAGRTKIAMKVILPLLAGLLLGELAAHGQDPVALFLSPEQICAPANLILENRSSDATIYRWYVDGLNVPGNIDDDLEWNFVNNTGAPYDTVFVEIKLEAENALGIVDEFTKVIAVFHEVNASFTADKTDGCHPLGVNFTNNSTGFTGTWEWNFGDGGSSGAAEPSHTYYNYFAPGVETYAVTMEATSPNGCKSTATENITVAPFTEALFSIDTIVGCGTLEVEIENLSTITADQYHWDMGDGTPGFTTMAGDLPFQYTYNNTSSDPSDIRQHTITLTVTSSSGSGSCTYVMQKEVTVYPGVTAGFNAAPVVDCSPLTTLFEDNSSNATNYLWEFGDGGTSSQKDPAHTYPPNLTGADLAYDARLIAWSNVACRDTTSYTRVTVKPHVEADFAIDAAEGCHPLTVNMTNNSLRAVTYLWEFIDDNGVVLDTETSETAAPYTFNNTGYTSVEVFTIRLTAYRDDCSSIIEKTVTVYPDVTAAFSLVSPDEGCSPFTMAFDNLSQGAALEYKWDFGDGGTSPLFEPSHTWEKNMSSADKIYQITLTATSEYLCSDNSVIDEVTVYPYTEAGFTVDVQEGCHPLTVTITDQSHGADDYTWIMGDGTTYYHSGGSFTHVYDNTGTSPADYVIRQEVENLRGCPGSLEKTITVNPELTSDFTASAFAGCDGLAVQFTSLSGNADSYLWEFDDGATSVEEHPEHTFFNPGIADTVFTVRLTAYSAGGECVEVRERDITIHGRVTAGFSFPEGTGCNPFDLEFTSSSSGGQSYSWDFGDGSPPLNTASALPVTHTFTNTGFTGISEYNVSLTATNYAGCSDVVTIPVRVYPDINSLFSATDTEGCHPLTVGFENLSQGGYHYNWDFGDGTFSGTTDAGHVFTNTGLADSIYTVKLIATAENNVCSDSFSVDITVHPYVNAEFNHAGSPRCTPFEVLFENASVNSGEFHWDFGDGNDTIIYNSNPFEYTYANTGFSSVALYDVTMTAVSLQNCTSTVTKTVSVYPDIEAAFLADVEEGCQPLSVNFTNTGNGGFHYLWDFGDGSSSAEASPSHIFTNTGTTDSLYRVKLVATAENNACSDSFYVDIRVYPAVSANFEFPEGVQCAPADFSFTNTSSGGSIFRWDFGDGTGSIANSTDVVSHIFGNSSYDDRQEYLVTLEAESSAGCIDSITRSVFVHHNIRAMVNPSATEGCHPLDVAFENVSPGGYTYSWDFGDGATTGKISPSHTFTNFTGSVLTRQVTLTASSEDFCQSDTTFNITINPLPKPFINIENSISCPPFDLLVENGTTGDNNYTWLTGDGNSRTTSSAAPFTHRYMNDGDDIAGYDLTLIAETQQGCVDSALQRVFVYPGVISSFTSETEGCSPLTVRFTDESVRAVSHQWDLGDGGISKLKDPTNQYFNNSVNDTSFYVRQIVISKYGCADTSGYSIDVWPQPVSDFTALPTHQTWPSSTVELVNSTNRGYWDFRWDFDDGNMSSEMDPGSHVFGDYGEYEIALHVSGGNCSDSTTRRIRIFPAPPIASFEVPAPGCVPLPVQFVNNSVYGHTYLWDFGDGNTSSQSEPYHVFDSAGIYNVTLTVTGDGGTQTAYREVEAYTLPVAGFMVSPSLVMLPNQEVQLFNQSESGNRYLWDFGDGNQSTEENPLYQYTAVGEYDISLRVWTEMECYAELVNYGSVTVTGEGVLRYPNAFKPDVYGPSGGYYDRNAANPNTVFYPLHAGIEEYHMEIYNRWGELLFVSDDVNIGWDGYYQGSISKQDVYVWKTWGTYINGEKFIKAGNVTLLR